MYKWVFSERLKVSGDEHRRIAWGRVFQARGPATAKARSPGVECRVASTVKSAEEAERRRQLRQQRILGQIMYNNNRQFNL